MGEVISYTDLVRQHQISLLEHKRREYREREDYLGRLRRLLFQIEGQMRQAEMLQLQVFRDLAEDFKIPIAFPDLGDRVALQEFFLNDPAMLIFKEFLAERLSAPDCLEKLAELRQKITEPPGA
ncbi:MAG: hypothetical protein PHU44_16420 [Syntrophales bacterium]|nr:hypothetical protein [Syntrophales bacterium]MDD5641094.1 hypothetical protein [Syntrophales bacterium]